MTQVKKAHVIIVGNEKGGSGKTTTAMHVIVALLLKGFSVGSVDLDSRQRTLSRYIENRRQTTMKKGISLPTSHHVVIDRSNLPTVELVQQEENERFEQAVLPLMAECDFVVIDSPGSDTHLARLAHSYADTVLTPINDSFLDLDVLGQVDSEKHQVKRPSIYSEMVFQQKIQRATRDGGSIDWVVMRNRLSNTNARNKTNVGKALQDLSKRVAFRVAHGFGERVIFRELFLDGLTVLDVMNQKTGVKPTVSHVAARQEVRELLRALNIEKLNAANANKAAKAEHAPAASADPAWQQAVRSVTADMAPA